MNDKLNNVTILPPFKKFCMTIGELPSSYLESMTYYESLLWLTKYLGDTVIPALNANGEAVIELQEKYIELKNYVDNYFENLDVQEEINNKLDDMAEHGELAEIISAYLQMFSVLGFDTKADLKLAENLVDGSIAKTLGDSSYGTGDGNFYKIRELAPGEEPDDDELVALTNYPTLVAEKIPDYRMNAVENRLDTLEDTTIPAIQSDITDIENVIDSLNLNKKYLFVGDSYTEGYSPDGTITNYPTVFKQNMGLSNDQVVVAYGGGYGFARTGYLFSTIIYNLSADPDITDVIILGGYNDRGFNFSDIKQGISDCKTLINTKFPKATIHIGQVGNSNNAARTYELTNVTSSYMAACNELNVKYINNMQYVLNNYFVDFSSDGFHPNQTGQNAIALALQEYFVNDYLLVNYPLIGFNANAETGFTLPANLDTKITTKICNENTFISCKSYVDVGVTSTSMVCNTNYKIATISAGYIVGSVYYTNMANVDFLVKTDGSFKKVAGQVKFDNNGLYISFCDINNDGSNFGTYSAVTEIIIPPFEAMFISDLC